MSEDVSIPDFKPNFYIDRQFGWPIQIEVDKGIIVKFAPNDLEPKLSAEYVGKTISFFKEDFENRMKPAFYRVHNRDLSHKLAAVNIAHAYGIEALNRFDDKTGKYKTIYSHWSNVEGDRIKEAKQLIKDIAAEHNFIVEVDFTKFGYY